jgi:hypothetical protein
MIKQLWINSKPLLDDEGSPLEAERIEFNDDEIIGYIGRSEVFTLRGLHPDRNTYEVKDEKGEQVTPDKSELGQLKARVDILEKSSLEKM